MNTKPLISSLACLALVASAAPAATQAAGTPLRIEKAYAFRGQTPGVAQTRVIVVFKTQHQLPRSSDGHLQAGATLDGEHSTGLRTVGRRASNCYTISYPLHAGRLNSTHGQKTGVGTRHTLSLSLVGAASGGHAKATVTIRASHAGDVSGAPLGC